MAVWGELRWGAGILLANRYIQSCYSYGNGPLCHPQTLTVGRVLKPCVSGLRRCLVIAPNQPGMDLGRLPSSSAFSKAGSALPVSLICYPGNLSQRRLCCSGDWDGGRLPLVGFSTSCSDAPGPASETAFWTSCISGLDAVKSSLKCCSALISLLSRMPQVWSLTGQTKFQNHYCGPEPASCSYSNISCWERKSSQNIQLPFPSYPSGIPIIKKAGWLFEKLMSFPSPAFDFLLFWLLKLILHSRHGIFHCQV